MSLSDTTATLSVLAEQVLRSPANRGPLEGATHVGVSGSVGDGPYVQIWLKLAGGTIEEAAFRTPGCPSSTAAAGVLCALIAGKSVERVKTLTRDDLKAVVGVLPDGKGHYIDQSIEALMKALQGEA